MCVGLAMPVVLRALTCSGHPLYNHYVAVERGAGGIRVTADQTSAAALTNKVGMIVFGSVFMLLLWLWLGDEEKRVQLTANSAVNPLHH